MKMKIEVASSDKPEEPTGVVVHLKYTPAELRQLATALNELADGKLPGNAMRKAMPIGLLFFVREEEQLVQLAPAGVKVPS